ncbi:hypothetical protein HBH56_065720 [Parastagonospora nodorum]|uniref:Uncharacterized protein n=1 Tax=Phaeosphaeria nodorum (strain SN15 / ATCC MYA-4574 / FGSC 10173) TaxID=321614 RepID=A0A7U2EUZ4_PHANO|nr:hypothetical protein HBH56_065720 [Parastagonospora nodorum]QRC93291.1 hypothetical protein JI435_403550 [Parastagonospora nodorum SN15]KAH3932781.1 hypothetical protein HBH54_082370 [Parastagonospora nodorum]KAH4143475.1 hypothetical protein HBH45_037390 [Parastagonospora nodorum]KAH4165486.1 hypothetical protein HBH44_065950 [Parastagonospora nodorum]
MSNSCLLQKSESSGPSCRDMSRTRLKEHHTIQVTLTSPANIHHTTRPSLHLTYHYLLLNPHSTISLNK